jgi:hypothetical protein
MSKEIILTPARTTDTESSSMISPNTQTLYAPRADVNNPNEYGLISYSDLGDFTYTQEEIDNKGAETLDSAKGYADSQDAIVLASANEHSDNNLEIAKQHSDNNLETAKSYTDNKLLNYYTKVEVDNKNEDVLNSAKKYTYSKEEIDDKDRALSVKIEAVEDKSDGRLKALSFDDNDQIIAWINGTYTYTDSVTGEIITPSDVTIGQNIYNKNLVQNDYWVSKLPITSINDLSILITDKNELNATDVKFNPENENKLSAANVQDAVDELTEVVENRTAIFELGNFVLNSENWALNSENGLYEYIFTNEALTNAITQIIEFTPNVESAKLINDNNIVIYNNIETIDNGGITQAIIRAESKPNFDIVCQVRIKTNALHLTGSAKLYASDVMFKNNRTDLGATDVQDAIVEINNKENANLIALNEHKNNTIKELNKLKLSIKPQIEKWTEKTWNGQLPPEGLGGDLIWTDGNNIYYSYNNSHYVLDTETSTWSYKIWKNAPNFLGSAVWSDGENIYTSADLGISYTYTLDVETSTWTRKVWNGYDNINGYYVWTDGKDIYYSWGEVQYVLDRETSTWAEKTWNGLINFDGHSVWTDGINIYYSFGANQYVLDVETSTWTEKTWSGLTYFNGDGIWTDGSNIYIPSSSTQYVLNVETSTWIRKVFNNPATAVGTSFDSRFIWTDGTNIYYSDRSFNYILNKITLKY